MTYSHSCRKGDSVTAGLFHGSPVCLYVQNALGLDRFRRFHCYTAEVLELPIDESIHAIRARLEEFIFGGFHLKITTVWVAKIAGCG